VERLALGDFVVAICALEAGEVELAATGALKRRAGDVTIAAGARVASEQFVEVRLAIRFLALFAELVAGEGGRTHCAHEMIRVPRHAERRQVFTLVRNGKNEGMKSEYI
jgi:hypothetical protein